MTAALDALISDIAANTLTATQQGALISALSVISPVFPSPDGLSDSIPLSEEALARLWITVLYTINGEAVVSPPTLVNEILATAPVVVTPSPGVGEVTISITEPARGFENSPAAVTLSGGSQAIAGVTVTPRTSGKLKVRISGVVQNADTSNTIRPVTLSVAANGVTPALETLTTFHPAPATSAPFGTPFSLVVDLDQAQTPTTFPLDTPVLINAVAVGDASGQLSIPIRGLQLEVEEAWS
jgi:hypothetical protein